MAYSKDKIHIVIGVSKDMHSKLTEIANSKEISLAGLVRTILADYLKAHKD